MISLPYLGLHICQLVIKLGCFVLENDVYLFIIAISTADGNRSPGPLTVLASKHRKPLNISLLPAVTALFNTDKFWALLSVSCDDTFYIVSSAHEKKDYRGQEGMFL